MKVKEVMALAAANLGRDDLIAAIDQLTGDPSGELLFLLRCYNLVENELALDYLPLEWEETVALQEGEVPISALSFAPVCILKVFSEEKEVQFIARPDRIVPHVSKPDGFVRVRYSYSPAEKKIEEEGSFSGRVSARLMSYGVACEYCLSHFQYEEAKLWEGRFQDAIRAANMVRRKLKMRARRWV